MRRKQLTSTEKEELIGLKHAGATYVELAKKFRISERRAMQLVKNAREKSEIIEENKTISDTMTALQPEITLPTTEEQKTGETKGQKNTPSLETPITEEKKVDEILPLTADDIKYNSAEELGAPKLQPEISQGQITNNERTAAAESAARFVCDTLNIICEAQLKKPLTDSERKTMITYGKPFWNYYLPENTNNKAVVAFMYGGAMVGIALARKNEIQTLMKNNKDVEQKQT